MNLLRHFKVISLIFISLCGLYLYVLFLILFDLLINNLILILILYLHNLLLIALIISKVVKMHFFKDIHIKSALSRCIFDLL